ncbi:MAG: hypothetical protein M1816_007456 [Peltula sp. TS41687]|nr:MAG: hypothetical protein M1816_007456 [Peltula sp. TS41687]
MPVELRKRKAPAVPAPAPPSKKKSESAKSAAGAKDPAKDVKDSDNKKETKTAAANGTTAPTTTKVAVGDVIDLDGFGGDVETQDGEKTTLKKLVDESKSGIVLFTYPKASTPGCTTQACLFRDTYTALTSTGLSIYGLSTDSPKANTTFKTKQNLPYTLLCDPSASLIGAIGFKKSPKGTTRGVFVIDKDGKILAAEPGGPAATVEVVKKLVGDDDVVDEKTAKEAEAAEAEAGETEGAKDQVEVDRSASTTDEKKKEDEAMADVAADVADTAAKVDDENE